MSDKTDIDFPPAFTDWIADGSTVARLTRVLEQVNVSDLGDGKGKVLRIETWKGDQTVVLDQAAADHVAALLSAKAG